MIPQAAIIQQIQQSAQAVGLDPAIAVQVARQESGLNQDARGAAGEIGIFQLRLRTAADLGVNAYDWIQNIQGGVRYLKQLLDRFNGNLAQALAAYNAGPGRVGQAVESGGSWFSLIPSSTQKYVAAILAALGPGTAISPSPDIERAGAAGSLAVSSRGNYIVVASGAPPSNASWLPLAALGVGVLAWAFWES